MTPDNPRELIAEAERHQELVVCGNAQHTNFDVGCPDCAVVCDYCTCPWPCDARKCADALAAPLDPVKVAEVLDGVLSGCSARMYITGAALADALCEAYTEGKLT